MRKGFQLTTVNAPVDEIWNTIRNFHGMSWTAGVTTKCVPARDVDPHTAGAKRVLNDAFQEILHELKAADHSIRYSVDGGPSPLNEVDGFIGLLRVSPNTDTDTSCVEWFSSWNGKDQETSEFCNPIYAAFLAELKSKAE